MHWLGKKKFRQKSWQGKIEPVWRRKAKNQAKKYLKTPSKKFQNIILWSLTDKRVLTDETT